MKFTQIKKIDNINELDGYLNPKTIPVGLVKTMLRNTKDLNIVKIDTDETCGVMLYDLNRDKYLVFTDAKHDDFIQDNSKTIQDIFRSLAKDFKNIEQSFMKNNRMKELKDIITDNEMVKHYGVSIGVPDLIISTDIGNNFTIADDIGYGSFVEIQYYDLICEDKEALSLIEFENIMASREKDNRKNI